MAHEPVDAWFWRLMAENDQDEDKVIALMIAGLPDRPDGAVIVEKALNMGLRAYVLSKMPYQSRGSN